MRNSILVNLTALAVVVIAGGARTASAADLEGVPYTKENFIMPVYNWSGVYVGGNIGYGRGRSSDPSGLSPGGPPALFTDSVRSNMNGIVGGGQLGYNSQ